MAPAPSSGYAGLRAPGGSRGSPGVPGASGVGRSRRADGGRCTLQDDRYPRQPRVTIANVSETQKKAPPGIPKDTRRGRVLSSVCWASRDRKSTRLNSSHVKISYAVFCLKKKNKTKQ